VPVAPLAPPEIFTASPAETKPLPAAKTLKFVHRLPQEVPLPLTLTEPSTRHVAAFEAAIPPNRKMMVTKRVHGTPLICVLDTATWSNLTLPPIEFAIVSAAPDVEPPPARVPSGLPGLVLLFDV
jgi:hypothetical protein